MIQSFPIDAGTPTWRALRAGINERIGELLNMLETPSDEVTTATIRGQIKELRLLIARVEPALPATVKRDAESNLTPLYS